MASSTHDVTPKSNDDSGVLQWFGGITGFVCIDHKQPIPLLDLEGKKNILRAPA